MKFRNFPEQALGTKARIKVLMHLLSEGIPTSERELADILGISHMAVNKAMKDFFDLNLVSAMRVGNVNAWKVKEGSYAHTALKSLSFLAQNSPLKHLQMEIKSTLGSYMVTRAVIFGSVAEGRELPDSDIDLLVIIRKEYQKDSVMSALSKLAEKCLLLYGNRLSPFILTEAEAALPRHRNIIKNAERGIVVMA